MGGFTLDTVKYLSTQDISVIWGITKRRVQNLCANNRIPGVFRIGNMWAIPADAVKPRDARVCRHSEAIIPSGTLMHKARKNIKAIVAISIKEFKAEGLSSVDALQALVVFFGAKLLEAYIHDFEICLNTCESFFGYKMPVPVSSNVNQSIEKYITENEKCLDDSLAWIYQFGTKISDKFKYKETQFFTEKYMISTLVNSLHVDSDSKIIDPACGGGNFLLYSFELLAGQMTVKGNRDKAKCAIDNLYGYEIDRFLAYVASFNLKMKALAFISKENGVSVDTFHSFHPKIFYPQKDSIPGFLDTEWDKQFVVNCDSGEVIRLVDAFAGVNVVVTNPPFQTIKGMPTEQKEYLRGHYPMAKCDMCNAFIERIMEILPFGGKSAMVTQNSWMYLDSFTSLRGKLLKEYTIDNIWELGSNAFYDISGEKANVALVTFTKSLPDKEHEIGLSLLRNMSIKGIERTLKGNGSHLLFVKQIDILNNKGFRFDLVSTGHLKSLQASCSQYKDYAVPMQGTSTGDAKNLIDYYWKHIDDEDWIPVSKGGGYSRFEGLNSYCVKWGKDGEHVRNTKGSAIRNANYFDQTQLVFSDTGTAGLNVRVLMPGQIFVASGPGIRIKKGRELSHLAFLNSRFASFYVRLISPKLTIAAGYIGQIPVTEQILNSLILEKSAKQCLQSKKHRLAKRPNNMEFSYVRHTEGKSISEMARTWFMEDINDEWTQLLNEQKIEDTITQKMHLTSEDWQVINNDIGERIIFASGNEGEEKAILESDISGILRYDCFPKRTKASKKSLGADGLIEYISQLRGISCEKVYSIISEQFNWFENNYIDLYMHALVVSAMKYREAGNANLSADALLSEMCISDKQDALYAKKWIEERFNIVHGSFFGGKPLLEYNPARKTIVQAEE
jgi:Type I restriction-modification system methyltransferase subunit